MRITTAQSAPFTKRGKQAVNADENFLTFVFQTPFLTAIAPERVISNGRSRAQAGLDIATRSSRL
ncbi:hypothetical protein [Rhizobium leguminosarum]|uniref:hypothetical protein n=1 Tax=Rhizobium leguminosarum TaxID=384 RepID=UPI001C985A24|nr:hypothetical protein [Rhizobium leguminosarum]MBY5696789.1 hypothetical protein [Rhizobium leguminosarum]